MKVLFCGLGSIGQRHLRNLRGLMGDELEVLAYRQTRHVPLLTGAMTSQADGDLESAYSIRSFDNLEDALHEHPSVAFITNPNTLHVPTAHAAARAGCHLFIEKPLSHSLDGVRELIETVESKKLVAFVAYQFRFHPGLKLVKSLVEKGQLGNLVSAHIVNGEYLPDWHPYEDYHDTHPARRELGGGCLNIQTHELDYAHWLFGLPRRVYACGGHLSSLEVDVEDSVSILMSCGESESPLPVHIHLDYLQRPPQRRCEVVGDEGKAIFDYYANRVDVFDTATGERETHAPDHFERNEMFVDELEHFLHCVRGEETPVVDLREGLKSLQISAAAAESLRTGAAVSVTNARGEAGDG
jgi:predicted dehydrogenase